MNKTSLIDSRTREIVAAAAEVHKMMGAGFLDPVYQEALALEFSWRGIPFRKDVPLLISYKSAILSTSMKAQFVCFDEVLVELNSPDDTELNATTRMMNNLKATGLETGILLYFGGESLEYRFLSLGKDESERVTYGQRHGE